MPPLLSRWRVTFAEEGLDGADAAGRGERGFRAHPVQVVAGDDQQRGGDHRPTPWAATKAG